MTLWERVEELTRRVSDLEERLPKPIPVVTPLDGAWVARGVLAEAVTAQVELQQSAAKKTPEVQAIEAGLMPAPKSPERRVYEACSRVDWASLLEQWSDQDVWPADELVELAGMAALIFARARARVALEKP